MLEEVAEELEEKLPSREKEVTRQSVTRQDKRSDRESKDSGREGEGEERLQSPLSWEALPSGHVPGGRSRCAERGQ